MNLPALLVISGYAFSAPCSLMKATAFLTIATASSLLAPSAAMAAVPPKTSVAARAEISDFLNQMFTFYLRVDWLGSGSRDRARQNCHKRANHPLKCLSVVQLTLAKAFGSGGFHPSRCGESAAPDVQFNFQLKSSFRGDAKHRTRNL